mgnify:CR=1
MLISSRNPKKLVLKVPAEFMGKEEDENPVLFISDLIYPKKKQPNSWETLTRKLLGFIHNE